MADESGGDIVGWLMRADPVLAAMVPPDRMKLGALPENVPLPALLIRRVSSNERQTLIRGAFVRTTDRIAVTVRAATYRDQRLIIKAVSRACAGRTGNIAGALRVSILTDGLGPDVDGPGNSFEQTQDFRVSYDAPA